MTTRSEIIRDKLVAGGTPWPPRFQVFADVTAELWGELVSRRRTFLALDNDQDQALVGDVLVFVCPYPERGAEPEVRQITHIWEHDGIAPGWAIASLRPVRLAPA
jgi:hypothetical protein